MRNKEIEVKLLLEENYPNAKQGKCLFVARKISNIYAEERVTVIKYDQHGIPLTTPYPTPDAPG